MHFVLLGLLTNFGGQRQTYPFKVDKRQLASGSNLKHDVVLWQMVPGSSKSENGKY